MVRIKSVHACCAHLIHISAQASSVRGTLRVKLFTSPTQEMDLGILSAVKQACGRSSPSLHTAACKALLLAPSRDTNPRKVMISLTFLASKCFVPKSAGLLTPGSRSSTIRCSVMSLQPQCPGLDVSDTSRSTAVRNAASCLSISR